MLIDTNDIIFNTFQDNNLEHLNLLQSFKEESKSKFIHFIVERLLQNRNQKSFPFDTGFVISLDSGESIGYLFISSKRNDEVFLEYSILKNKRKMGYGKKCLSLVTDFLFEHYNIRDIALDIDVSNEASMRTAMACGYYEDEYLEEGKFIYRKYNLNYTNKRKNGK
ncbi:MAG: GNAT family N-acetyltransferase [Erysipelotrichaceae bacterium]|nr:GNAT family N-acetyltransferase [Erysipelotrichaceae bacterium]